MPVQARQIPPASRVLEAGGKIEQGKIFKIGEKLVRLYHKELYQDRPGGTEYYNPLEQKPVSQSSS